MDRISPLLEARTVSGCPRHNLLQGSLALAGDCSGRGWPLLLPELQALMVLCRWQLYEAWRCLSGYSCKPWLRGSRRGSACSLPLASRGSKLRVQAKSGRRVRRRTRGRVQVDVPVQLREGGLVASPHWP